MTRHFPDTGANLPLVVSATPVPPLGSFGIGPRGDRLYRAVLRDRHVPVAVLAERFGWPRAEVEDELAPVVALGLLVVRDGVVVAVSPHLALGRLADLEARTLLERERALDALRGAIPDYAAEERGGDLTQARLQPVEVHTGPDVGAVVDAMIRSTTGELLLIHTTEWLDDPGWSKDDTLLARETAGGRPVRSIYPTAALHRPAALEIVRQWAEIGENVRLLPSPPTRLIVFGSQAALIPVEWGRQPTRRVVVRTPGVVEAMRHFFDILWRQAAPLPGSDDTRHLGGRGQVLRMLAAGAKDETIARQLGVSLRTVRRRVADLLGELDATTRFQAGVEAARRKLV
jgi:DNA-binding CsgD family transcriptional regulator